MVLDIYHETIVIRLQRRLLSIFLSAFCWKLWRAECAFLLSNRWWQWRNRWAGERQGFVHMQVCMYACTHCIGRRKKKLLASKLRRKLNSPDGKSTGATVAASGLISQRRTTHTHTHTAPTTSLCSRALDYYAAINKNIREKRGRDKYCLYTYLYCCCVLCCSFSDWMPLVCHMPLVGIVCRHGVGGVLVGNHNCHPRETQR